ncbi:Putative lipoprotein LppC [archaeon HR06]|nr:Putative lipoprotein LppC [archaeon HR06]
MNKKLIIATTIVVVIAIIFVFLVSTKTTIITTELKTTITTTEFKGQKFEGFVILSKAFGEGENIPIKYTCDGENISPPLEWKSIPENSVSLALIVEDPDAPFGTFTHWIVFNIDKNIKGFEEGKLPEKVKQGVNDFGNNRYDGPCPPKGEKHRYIFRLFALDKELDLSKDVKRNEFLNAIKAHVIAEARLTGIYSR